MISATGLARTVDFEQMCDQGKDEEDLQPLLYLTSPFPVHLLSSAFWSHAISAHSVKPF